MLLAVLVALSGGYFALVSYQNADGSAGTSSNPHESADVKGSPLAPSVGLERLAVSHAPTASTDAGKTIAVDASSSALDTTADSNVEPTDSDGAANGDVGDLTDTDTTAAQTQSSASAEPLQDDSSAGIEAKSEEAKYRSRRARRAERRRRQRNKRDAQQSRQNEDDPSADSSESSEEPVAKKTGRTKVDGIAIASEPDDDEPAAKPSKTNLTTVGNTPIAEGFDE